MFWHRISIQVFEYFNWDFLYCNRDFITKQAKIPAFHIVVWVGVLFLNVQFLEDIYQQCHALFAQ